MVGQKLIEQCAKDKNVENDKKSSSTRKETFFAHFKRKENSDKIYETFLLIGRLKKSKLL